MSNTVVDYTAEIFAALGVTPETHPEFYFVLNEGVEWNLANFLDFYSEQDADAQPTSLLSGTPEADGIAVRLVGIATGKINMPWYRPDSKVWFCNSYHAHKLNGCHTSISFAHAVHDALVVALGLNTKGD